MSDYEVVEQSSKKTKNKVLLADFLPTTILVPKDTMLYLFRMDNEDKWVFINEVKPTLKKDTLISDYGVGIYKVEIRKKNGKYVRPNKFFVKIDEDHNIDFSLEPINPPDTEGTLENENDTENDYNEESYEFHPDFANIFNAFSKMQENQLKQIKEMYEKQLEMLKNLYLNRHEDPLDRLIRLKTKQIEMHILKEMERDDDVEPDDESMYLAGLQPEEQALILRINEALSQNKIGTFWMLFQELKEKNGTVAKLLLTELLDKVMNGEIDFSKLFSKSKQEGNNNASE